MRPAYQTRASFSVGGKGTVSFASNGKRARLGYFLGPGSPIGRHPVGGVFSPGGGVGEKKLLAGPAGSAFGFSRRLFTISPPCSTPFFTSSVILVGLIST